MSTLLEQSIATFARWRADMIAGIEFYKSWLDTNGSADIQQSLRIYDLVESIKQDRMTLALIAEYSRGKTELINALLFGNFKRRILPSDVGRTTMCPTEIMHDPREEPYIRLLPIETRRCNETIASFKRKPVEWIRIRLDPDSEADMVQGFRALVQTKTVSRQEAMALGLFDPTAADSTAVPVNDPNSVEIPAWRHALINYPHPLLTDGLVLLDTPGLNALGTEPELTMSMIPNAHAVLFLLAIDTGVTRSDLEVWRRHVQPRVQHRLAVLNKIDLLWDDIKSDEEIQESTRRQVDTTARLLELPTRLVLPLSAKKALIARVRGDPALLERSGIGALEHLLAEEIVPAKQEIIRSAIEREIGSMVESSRQGIITQFNGLRTEFKGLMELGGKTDNVARAMLVRVERDRSSYLESAARCRASFETVNQQGSVLLASLSDEALEKLMNKDRRFIEHAWSTAGLIKNMQALFGHFSLQSRRILTYSEEILALVERTYAEFHEKAGFEKLTPPTLNLEKHSLAIQQLRQATIDYCHHPKQILTEKHFLVSHFYDSLVAEAHRVFEMTRDDTASWLRAALNPLTSVIREHEVQLNRRVDNLHKLQDNLASLDERSKQIEQQLTALKTQHDVLLGIRNDMAAVRSAGASSTAPGLGSANESQAGPIGRAA